MFLPASDIRHVQAHKTARFRLLGSKCVQDIQLGRDFNASHLHLKAARNFRFDADEQKTFTTRVIQL